MATIIASQPACGRRAPAKGRLRLLACKAPLRGVPLLPYRNEGLSPSTKEARLPRVAWPPTRTRRLLPAPRCLALRPHNGRYGLRRQDAHATTTTAGPHSRLRQWTFGYERSSTKSSRCVDSTLTTGPTRVTWHSIRLPRLMSASGRQGSPGPSLSVTRGAPPLPISPAKRRGPGHPRGGVGGGRPPHHGREVPAGVPPLGWQVA